MRALRRDTENQIDTVLMALKANDKACSSHQNNALPLATVNRGSPKSQCGRETWDMSPPHTRTAPLSKVGGPNSVCCASRSFCRLN